MILSNSKIKQRIDTGEILISPFNESQLNITSYDIRLSKQLAYYPGLIDAAKPNEVERIEIPDDGLILEPNRLYLGCTEETIGLTNLVAELGGKSSIGRLGVSIHVTAGFIDPGFLGQITLEIFCIQPVRIYAGMRIGQLWFTEVCGNLDGSYATTGHYIGQLAKGPVPSMSWKQIEEDKLCTSGQ